MGGQREDRAPLLVPAQRPRGADLQEQDRADIRQEQGELSVSTETSASTSSTASIFTTAIDIVTGKSGRRDLPPHSSVPATEGVDGADRRVRAREDRDGDDAADDQRQALRRRQTGPSRHQRLRDRLHRRQATAAAGQTKDRILPRQRRMITNPEPDDRRDQRDVDVRGARRPEDAAGDELMRELSRSLASDQDRRSSSNRQCPDRNNESNDRRRR